MDAIEIVRSARSEDRLTAVDYINEIIDDFTELHGDRLHGDDKAIIAGIGRIGDMPVTVIGVEKGKNTKDRILHNFGSAGPEGYRKALRLMKQAEKFHRPVLCFVDTAGAYCDVASEENGQGRAIAHNLYEMSDLKTPILSIIIGEGGSGGALALAHADRIWMVEDAYFSVVSPESCANILWKTTEKAPEAAASLRLTAKDLYKLKIIDRISPKGDQKGLKSEIEKELKMLMNTGMTELLEDRYEKYRKIGY